MTTNTKRTEARTKTSTANTPAESGVTSSAPIAAGDSGANLPEFGRLQDVQRLYGLKRGYTYQLINEGKIKSVSLRKPGSKFGCRLVHLQSVRDFLLSQLDAGNHGKGGAA